ncbi:hypothetical protein GUJ93_ZPchr0006g46292 [Zizania palustris]|uniref:non-specific serine/threonine protein kinase n=1 Tax=Zizania palustris TaxID=103762 RepID=A0A8J5T9K8_ZIZPA|nr:hypothetical protein GUJ93_ZPchr0006g46292 [Zizania palustris]
MASKQMEEIQRKLAVVAYPRANAPAQSLLFAGVERYRLLEWLFFRLLGDRSPFTQQNWQWDSLDRDEENSRIQHLAEITNFLGITPSVDTEAIQICPGPPRIPTPRLRRPPRIRRPASPCPPSEVRQESAVAAPQRFGTVALSDVRFVRRLGSGDIGSVYLAEVKGKGGDDGGSGSGGVAALVAAKVMDRKELAGRNKEGRARTEREILEAVDHPFLPRLYGVAEGDRWSCLLTEFCPGGDLHVLRQR